MFPSERVRISENDGDSLEQLQSIFEHLSDGVFLVKVIDGPDFVFEAFNRQTAEWVGVDRETARGKRLSELIPAPEAERVAAIYRRCVETGKTQRYEEKPQALQPDMTFQTTLIPVCDEQGAVRRIVGVARDITDQKRAELALSESQEMFAKAFRHGPQAMLIVRGSDGQYVDVNAAFELLFQCQREQVVGSRAAELSIWPDPQQRQELVAEVQRVGHVRDFPANLRTFKGETRDVLLAGDRILLGGE
jgi:PAS domain S-box-containing protein